MTLMGASGGCGADLKLPRMRLERSRYAADASRAQIDERRRNNCIVSHTGANYDSLTNDNDRRTRAAELLQKHA
jgi:hypothetical protein